MPPRKEVTRLSAKDELRFQSWAHRNGITDVDHPDSHYDYRGYWRSVKGADHPQGVHFPDTFKQHGHPTFSVESKYSRGPGDGGRWIGETFIPQNAEQAQRDVLPTQRPRNRAGEVRRSFAYRHPNLAGIVEGTGRVAKGVASFVPDALKALTSYTPEELRTPEVKQQLHDMGVDPDRLLHEALRARGAGAPVGAAEGALALGKGMLGFGYNLQRAIQGGDALYGQDEPGGRFHILNTDINPRERASAITEMGLNAAMLGAGRYGELARAAKAAGRPMPSQFPTFGRLARSVGETAADESGSVPGSRGRSRRPKPENSANAPGSRTNNPRIDIQPSASESEGFRRYKLTENVRNMDDMLRSGEGFSLEPGTFTPTRRSGYAVADRDFTLDLTGIENRRTAMHEFLDRPDVRAELSKPGRVVGGWGNEINVTRVIENRGEAMRFARAGKQQALGHLERGRYIGDVPTKNAISSLADEYRQSRGLTHEPMPDVTNIDEAAHRMIAEHYENTPSMHNDPNAQAAYRALMKTVNDQAEFLKSKGYQFNAVENPTIQSIYETPEQMHADVLQNKKLDVNRTTMDQANLPEGQAPVVPGQAHPILTNAENDLFRWVHDILGHTATESDFSLAGEEQAFRNHAATMPPEAWPALAGETRGQTATYFHGRRPGTFVEQKAMTLPPHMLGDYPAFTAPERITAAAVRGIDGQIYTGLHHADAADVAAEAIRANPESRALANRKFGGSASLRSNDGFVTSRGRFVTRAEAKRIAQGAEQIGTQYYNDLHSSDLKDVRRILSQAGEHRVPREMLPELQPDLGDPKVSPDYVDPTQPIPGFMGTGANSMTPTDVANTRIFGAPEPAPAVFGGTYRALDEMLPYLTPDEIARVVSPRGALLRESINTRAPLLGPDEPLIHAALQGQLARGGYESVLPELRALYGPEAERFASIWAAVSPRQLNESALAMTQDIFNKWHDAGGLNADPRVLRQLARSSELPARYDNTLAALTAVDPLGLKLSGNKVGSFYPNLLGNLNPVTLDALQSYGMGINPNRFGNYGSYLTGTGQIRRVAAALGRETGTPWAPAQAQEGMWSTIRAMLNLADAERAIARGTLPEMAGQVTPELAGQQWSPQVFRDVLTEGGAMGEDVAPTLHFPLAEPSLLRSLAETIQNSARKRYRF